MATSVASLATSPMVAVARWTRLRAIVFGRYPSSAAAARIRSCVSAETRTSPPLRTLLAVWKLTPARAATSLIDTYRRRAITSFRRVLRRSPAPLTRADPPEPTGPSASCQTVSERSPRRLEPPPVSGQEGASKRFTPAIQPKEPVQVPAAPAPEEAAHPTP